MSRLKKIGWALAPPAGRRPRWGKEHLSRNGTKMLCGRSRPALGELPKDGDDA